MKSFKVQTIAVAIFCLGLGLVLVFIGKLVLWISGTVLILAGVVLLFRKGLFKRQRTSTG